ncbi:MAG: hypothetical protein HY908_20010 [Myxococcales bacterium]|nr:hypothetical protein [Myxococcales bacterium]
MKRSIPLGTTGAVAVLGMLAGLPSCGSKAATDAPASTSGVAAKGSTTPAVATTSNAASPATTSAPSVAPTVVPTAEGGGLAVAERAARVSQCKPACEHRKSCGVPDADDVASCTQECEALGFLYHRDVVAEYAAADCETVKKTEAALSEAVYARHACARRDECFQTHDVEPCTLDLTALSWQPGHLAEYAGSPCETIKAGNEGHLMVRQWVKTCRHIVECGVKGGDLQRCLDVVRSNVMEKKVYGIEKLQQWDKDTCEVLRATVTLEDQRPVAPAAGGGGYRVPAGSGWFGGSWVDTNGRVHTHDGPGGAVF